MKTRKLSILADQWRVNNLRKQMGGNHWVAKSIEDKHLSYKTWPLIKFVEF